MQVYAQTVVKRNENLSNIIQNYLLAGIHYLILTDKVIFTEDMIFCNIYRRYDILYLICSK